MRQGSVNTRRAVPASRQTAEGLEPAERIRSLSWRWAGKALHAFSNAPSVVRRSNRTQCFKKWRRVVAALAAVALLCPPTVWAASASADALREEQPAKTQAGLEELPQALGDQEIPTVTLTEGFAVRYGYSGDSTVYRGRDAQGTPLLVRVFYGTVSVYDSPRSVSVSRVIPVTDDDIRRYFDRTKEYVTQQALLGRPPPGAIIPPLRLVKIGGGYQEGKLAIAVQPAVVDGHPLEAFSDDDLVAWNPFSMREVIVETRGVWKGYAELVQRAQDQVRSDPPLALLVERADKLLLGSQQRVEIPVSVSAAGVTVFQDVVWPLVLLMWAAGGRQQDPETVYDQVVADWTARAASGQAVDLASSARMNLLRFGGDRVDLVDAIHELPAFETGYRLAVARRLIRSGALPVLTSKRYQELFVNVVKPGRRVEAVREEDATREVAILVTEFPGMAPTKDVGLEEAKPLGLSEMHDLQISSGQAPPVGATGGLWVPPAPASLAVSVRMYVTPEVRRALPQDISALAKGSIELLDFDPASQPAMALGSVIVVGPGALPGLGARHVPVIQSQQLAWLAALRGQALWAMAWNPTFQNRVILWVQGSAGPVSLEGQSGFAFYV